MKNNNFEHKNKEMCVNVWVNFKNDLLCYLSQIIFKILQTFKAYSKTEYWRSFKHRGRASREGIFG